MRDGFGAFCPGRFRPRVGAAEGPLYGRRFAVKDLIDLAGHVTGGGNPDWARTHPPAAADAPVVAALLDAGAALVGKTITDELAFSLDGRNAHYGTPVNPAAPARLPGGSSSGSAAAVAGGLVDFALGTDTGGSVRVPASFCGVFGFRPTHGAVPTTGVIPFAPSFDTVGWFARDAALLAAVGETLLDEMPAMTLPRQALLFNDAFLLADPEVRQEVMTVAGRALEPLGIGNTDVVDVTDDRLESWTEAYRALQGDEIRRSLGPWIRENDPDFGPNIAPRFASVWEIPKADVEQGNQCRAAARATLDNILNEAILVLPSAPIVAPLRDIDEAELRLLYPRLLALTAPAGLSGLPQVTLPLCSLGEGPLGLSLIGPRGSDLALLRLAEAISSASGCAAR